MVIDFRPPPAPGPFQQINAAPINKPSGRFAHVARTPAWTLSLSLARTRLRWESWRAGVDKADSLSLFFQMNPAGPRF